MLNLRYRGVLPIKTDVKNVFLDVLLTKANGLPRCWRLQIFAALTMSMTLKYRLSETQRGLSNFISPQPEVTAHRITLSFLAKCDIHVSLE